MEVYEAAKGMQREKVVNKYNLCSFDLYFIADSETSKVFVLEVQLFHSS